jgi:hypothetical protein
MNIMTIVYDVGVLLMLLTLAGGVYGNIYMLWKLLGAFRYIEFSEARRMQAPNMGMPNMNQYTPASKQETDGSFIPRTEADAYLHEEANKISVAAGISDDEAINVLLEQIRRQNENKGTVANV